MAQDKLLGPRQVSVPGEGPRNKTAGGDQVLRADQMLLKGGGAPRKMSWERKELSSWVRADFRFLVLTDWEPGVALLSSQLGGEQTDGWPPSLLLQGPGCPGHTAPRIPRWCWTQNPSWVEMSGSCPGAGTVWTGCKSQPQLWRSGALVLKFPFQEPHEGILSDRFPARARGAGE